MSDTIIGIEVELNLKKKKYTEIWKYEDFIDFKLDKPDEIKPLEKEKRYYVEQLPSNRSPVPYDIHYPVALPLSPAGTEKLLKITEPGVYKATLEISTEEVKIIPVDENGDTIFDKNNEEIYKFIVQEHSIAERYFYSKRHVEQFVQLFNIEYSYTNNLVQFIPLYKDNINIFQYTWRLFAGVTKNFILEKEASSLNLTIGEKIHFGGKYIISLQVIDNDGNEYLHSQKFTLDPAYNIIKINQTTTKITFEADIDNFITWLTEETSDENYSEENEIASYKWQLINSETENIYSNTSNSFSLTINDLINRGITYTVSLKMLDQKNYASEQTKDFMIPLAGYTLVYQTARYIYLNASDDTVAENPIRYQWIITDYFGDTILESSQTELLVQLPVSDDYYKYYNKSLYKIEDQYHVESENRYYNIKLQVIDRDGNSHSVQRKIFVSPNYTENNHENIEITLSSTKAVTFSATNSNSAYTHQWTIQGETTQVNSEKTFTIDLEEGFYTIQLEITQTNNEKTTKNFELNLKNWES